MQQTRCGHRGAQGERRRGASGQVFGRAATVRFTGNAYRHPGATGRGQSAAHGVRGKRSSGNAGIAGRQEIHIHIELTWEIDMSKTTYVLGVSALTLLLNPAVYAADGDAGVSSTTRGAVVAELAAARKSGDILWGDQGLSLRERDG